MKVHKANTMDGRNLNKPPSGMPLQKTSKTSHSLRRIQKDLQKPSRQHRSAEGRVGGQPTFTTCEPSASKQHSKYAHAYILFRLYA